MDIPQGMVDSFKLIYDLGILLLVSVLLVVGLSNWSCQRSTVALALYIDV